VRAELGSAQPGSLLGSQSSLAFRGDGVSRKISLDASLVPACLTLQDEDDTQSAKFSFDSWSITGSEEQLTTFTFPPLLEEKIEPLTVPLQSIVDHYIRKSGGVLTDPKKAPERLRPFSAR
jgi:hypothetical protein